MVEAGPSRRARSRSRAARSSFSLRRRVTSPCAVSPPAPSIYRWSLRPRALIGDVQARLADHAGGESAVDRLPARLCASRWPTQLVLPAHVGASDRTLSSEEVERHSGAHHRGHARSRLRLESLIRTSHNPPDDVAHALVRAVSRLTLLDTSSGGDTAFGARASPGVATRHAECVRHIIAQKVWREMRADSNTVHLTAATLSGLRATAFSGNTTTGSGSVHF